jgi:pimeloyl-ACP methyl ester carboxylesterase
MHVQQYCRGNSYCKTLCRVIAGSLLCVLVTSCTSLSLEDCPKSSVLGVDKPRIRSSSLRMLLADEAAVAARFADAALMSAYAYVEDQDCGHAAKIEPSTADTLAGKLQAAGWQRVKAAEFIPACEDEIGLFYHVWQRQTPAATEVVLTFRGTWGFKDWWYGNLYWLRRLFSNDHQYARARNHAKRIIDLFRTHAAGKPVKFYATGHSLGGGLAQSVLYERPADFIQAIAFDPSSATAYTTRSDTTTPLTPCNCSGAVVEPRIYRVYESYEVLANLRIFHKFFFPPEAWINEVRFDYAESLNSVAQHSMTQLALKLVDKQNSVLLRPRASPWYAGIGNGCTARFESSLEKACSLSCAAKPATKPGTASGR